MSGCIITSPEGIDQRNRLAANAEALGSKLMPIVSMFCEFHGQHHAVQMEGAAVDRRYGQAPTEVVLSPSEEQEYTHFQHNSYCRECSSYHKIGACRGARTRADVGQ